MNVFNRSIAPNEVVDCVFSLRTTGLQQYDNYVKHVLIEKTSSFWTPIKNNKLKLFGYEPKTSSLQKSSAVTLMKKNSKLFLNLLINSQARKEDTGNFFSCESLNYPPALSINGKLRFGTKSDILVLLLEHQQSSFHIYPPGIQSIIFDGPAFVQAMKLPENVTTFIAFKKQFWYKILKRSRNISTIHVMFDQYLDNSLKESARINRGTSVAVEFSPNTVLPKKWHDFLCNSSNKTRLFVYLAEKDDVLTNTDKDIYVTKLTRITSLKATSTSDLTGEASISPTDHEEADTRMFLHCKHSSQQGLKNVLINTVDSDVVVIGIYLFKEIQLETLWIRFGVGKKVKFIACHEIANSLDPSLNAGLTFFHAFTGADTVSAFERHGKKTGWKTWIEMSEINQCFKQLSSPSCNAITADNTQKLERFVMKMYNKNIEVATLDEGRKAMVFEQRCHAEQRPST